MDGLRRSLLTNPKVRPPGLTRVDFIAFMARPKLVVIGLELPTFLFGAAGWVDQGAERRRDSGWNREPFLVAMGFARDNFAKVFF
jgi:hypothetical protein